jgi:hypothetical protein
MTSSKRWAKLPTRSDRGDLAPRPAATPAMPVSGTGPVSVPWAGRLT